MPNTEYFKYKALLESNPKFKLILDTIARAEGTYGKNSYSTKFGGGKVDYRKGKDTSVINGSSAHGRYQFMNDTWKGLKDSLALESFTPEEQDIAALKLLDQSGALAEFQKGNDMQGIFKAANVWSSLPVNEKGESAHKYGKGSGKEGQKQKAKPLTTVLSYMKSPEAERVKANEGFKKANEAFVKKDAATKQQVVDQYWKDVEKIRKNKDLSPEAKNNEVQFLNQKYYREGKMLAVNEDRVKKHNEYSSLTKEIANLANGYASSSDKGLSVVLPKDPYGNAKISKQRYNQIKEKIEKLGIKLPVASFKQLPSGELYLEPEYFKGLSAKIIKLSPPINRESALEKYGITQQEALEKGMFAQEAVEEEIDSPDEIEGTNPEDAEAEAKKKADQAKAEEARKAKEAASKRPPESFELLEGASRTDLIENRFKYIPGKQEIPFDALLGLASSAVGSAAADVDIKYRDEKISEGMLQYAQDIAKIKEMGLPPEIEGGLKAKLNSAYQTGLTNIVRSSNGNRNLVLGNQGQLDKARMAGIVDIATLDIDRRDKAMAAFGEVQKYINEFDSKRDIANNERRYAEDVKKQVAGATLAQQGMSNFIDAIQYAKENGPGSIKDMYRKKFAFDTTGLIEGAKDGEPGSPKYAEAINLKREATKSKQQAFGDFVGSLTRDEKDVATNFLKANPQYNPSTNSDANVMEFMEIVKTKFGTDEFKSEYQKGIGINTYDSVMAEKAKQKELEKINPDVAGVNRTEPSDVVSESGEKKAATQTATKEDDVVSLAQKAKEDQAKQKLIDASKTGAIVTTDKPLSKETMQENLFVKSKTGIDVKPENISQDTNDQRLANERLEKANSDLEHYLTVTQPKINQELAQKEQQGLIYQNQLKAMY